jgi:hypothetical protein
MPEDLQFAPLMVVQVFDKDQFGKDQSVGQFRMELNESQKVNKQAASSSAKIGAIFLLPSSSYALVLTHRFRSSRRTPSRSPLGGQST